MCTGTIADMLASCGRTEGLGTEVLDETNCRRLLYRSLAGGFERARRRRRERQTARATAMRRLPYRNGESAQRLRGRCAAVPGDREKIRLRLRGARLQPGRAARQDEFCADTTGGQ